MDPAAIHSSRIDMTEFEFQARCRGGGKSGCNLDTTRSSESTVSVEEFFRICAVYVLLAALLQRRGQR